MTYFKQTQGYPYGDCYRTCVACIIDAENLEDVPNFMKDGEEKFNEHYHKWLKENNYLSIAYELHESKILGSDLDGAFCLLGGLNTRTNIRHCCVGQVRHDKEKGLINYDVVHDPIEDNDTENIKFDFVYFIVGRLD